MKSQFIRSVSASFLCLCVLTALSGCVLNPYKELHEIQRKQKLAQQQLDAEKKKEQKAAWLAAVSKGEEPIPVEFAQIYLKDTFRGSICNGKIDVEIQIDKVEKNKNTPQPIANVYGLFRSFDQKGKPLEEFLRGEYSLLGGFLSLYSPKPKDDAPPLQTFTLNIDIARDSKGQGWVGSFESDAFGDCHEIEMASKSGATTIQLPPVTSDLAYTRAFHITQNYNMQTYYSARTPSARIYWLRISEREGNLDASYHIAALYEELGKTDAQNYQHAFQYYSAQAEGLNDVRIQEKLARLYENGLGTQMNLEKAQQLYRLAGEARKKFLHVCTSPPIKNFADAVMKRSQQSAKGGELLLGMTTGIRMNATNLRLIAIEPEDVTSLDKPFVCSFFSKRIDPKVDAELVSDGRYIEGPYGETRWVDNSLDKAGMMAIAGFVQEMAKTVPVITRFRIIPYGGTRYQIVYDSSTRMTVELN